MRHLLLALMITAAASASSAMPAEVNTATLAQLESVSGIGPALAQRIVEARARAPFKDWPDLLARVGGLGAARAAKLSAAGLSVDGAPYDIPAKPAR